MAFTFPEYESFDGLGLANLVKRKIISPQELLAAAIERIEKYNPSLNAVIHSMYEKARDAVQNNLSDGLFQGVPFLLKDLIADYAGEPMRMGSRFTKEFISTHDSELVTRFKKAGLVILGKTNTPEFGLGVITEPVLFGPTKNPWNLTRSTGGSSGGSAASVAARMVPLAHAGDGGGSIRIPASYCGLFGLKPSRGRTPAGPDVMRIWLGLVVEHGITRTVRDSAALLDVLAGPEIGSPISLPLPEKSFLKSLEEPCPPLRIAIVEEPFFPAKVEPEYTLALKKAAMLCQDLGHQIEPATISIEKDEVALAYLIFIVGQAAADLRSICKNMGRKPKTDELEKQTAVLCHAGQLFTAADFAWATNVLDLLGRTMATFLENYDVIMTPSMSSFSPEVGKFKPNRLEKGILELVHWLPQGGTFLHKVVKKAASRNFGFSPFTAIFNISGQPAMTVPLYSDKDGMPIGIQFAGRVGEDALLLRLAKQLEDAQPWDKRTPSMCNLYANAKKDNPQIGPRSCMSASEN